jgi:anti-sigma regulatory factor (Ser/Thr protein kinase)
MQADQTGSLGAGAAPSPGRDQPLSELEWFRARCRRQEMVIDTLSRAVSNFTSGTAALKAENAELREQVARRRGRADPGAQSHERVNGAELAEVTIPLGVQGPRVARSVIARCLAEHLGPRALEDAHLLVSELVTNSVCHNGLAEQGHVILRVHLWRETCRIEVEDPGWDGMIAPLSPDLSDGGGMGLNLVQMLSEQWGVVKAAGGPTRVWAKLSCAPAFV